MKINYLYLLQRFHLNLLRLILREISDPSKKNNYIAEIAEIFQQNIYHKS